MVEQWLNSTIHHKLYNVSFFMFLGFVIKQIGYNNHVIQICAFTKAMWNFLEIGYIQVDTSYLVFEFPVKENKMQWKLTCR